MAEATQTISNRRRRRNLQSGGDDRVLPIAMDRDVKEIMSSIVQRSVSIATQTTKEHVLKGFFPTPLTVTNDYAMEPDETLIQNAAHLIVAILARSLAHVTCKDYAMEPDETLIQNAAHLMVAILARSLAHVTCKEPIRGSISGQLRNSLQGLGVANELLDQAVQLVTNDNLDLGCVLIEQAATEKHLSV
ncbi:hypothetical protein ACS0TY_013501 [Phlomoides rotata]